MKRKQQRKEKISVVIPAKDEEETIAVVVKDVRHALDALHSYESEIIVVADHCTDATVDRATKQGAIVISNQLSAGKGHALATGFKAATGDIIIMMDADYSHVAEDIPKFIVPLKKDDVGMVIASRSLGGSGEYTFIRTLGNIFLTATLNVLFGQHLTDSLNGFKAFRKSQLNGHALSSASFEIEIELIYLTLLSGKHIVEIPSYERPRAGGQMKSHAVIHGLRFLSCILRKGVMYRIKKRYA